MRTIPFPKSVHNIIIAIDNDSYTVKFDYFYYQQIQQSLQLYQISL